MSGTKRMVKVDGYEFEAGSESHLSAIERERGKLTSELDSATKRADAAEVRARSFEVSLEQAKIDAKNVDIGAMVDARLALVDQARKILGDGYEHQGKADRDIMVDALSKSGTKVAEDASDDFVAGAFTAAVGRAAKDAEGAAKEPDEEEAAEETEEEPEKKSMDSRGFTRTTPRKDSPKPRPFQMPSLADKWRS